MVIRMTKEIRHFSKNKNLHLILSIIMTVLSIRNSSLYESVQFIV